MITKLVPSPTSCSCISDANTMILAAGCSIFANRRSNDWSKPKIVFQRVGMYYLRLALWRWWRRRWWWTACRCGWWLFCSCRSDRTPSWRCPRTPCRRRCCGTRLLRDRTNATEKTRPQTNGVIIREPVTSDFCNTLTMAPSFSIWAKPGAFGTCKAIAIGFYTAVTCKQ